MPLQNLFSHAHPERHGDCICHRHLVQRGGRPRCLGKLRRINGVGKFLIRSSRAFGARGTLMV